jgi:hypothetical protein
MSGVNLLKCCCGEEPQYREWPEEVLFSHRQINSEGNVVAWQGAFFCSEVEPSPDNYTKRFIVGRYASYSCGGPLFGGTWNRLNWQGGVEIYSTNLSGIPIDRSVEVEATIDNGLHDDYKQGPPQQQGSPDYYIDRGKVYWNYRGGVDEVSSTVVLPKTQTSGGGCQVAEVSGFGGVLWYPSMVMRHDITFEFMRLVAASYYLSGNYHEKSHGEIIYQVDLKIKW